MIQEIQTIALADAIEGSPEFRWRQVCRLYSEKLSTPYHETLKLPMPFVIQAMLERDLDGMDQDKLFESAVQFLGNTEEEEELLRQHIARWEAEDERGRKSGGKRKRRAKKPYSRQEVDKKPTIDRVYDMGDPDKE